MKLFCQIFSKTAPTPPEKPLHLRSRSQSCFWKSRSPAKQALNLLSLIWASLKAYIVEGLRNATDAYTVTVDLLDELISVFQMCYLVMNGGSCNSSSSTTSGGIIQVYYFKLCRSPGATRAAPTLAPPPPGARSSELVAGRPCGSKDGGGGTFSPI